MKNKEEFLNKIIDDLPMAEYRGQMTKDEWKGWFEDAYNEGYKQAQALQLQQTGVSGSVLKPQLCKDCNNFKEPNWTSKICGDCFFYDNNQQSNFIPKFK